MFLYDTALAEKRAVILGLETGHQEQVAIGCVNDEKISKSEYFRVSVSPG